MRLRLLLLGASLAAASALGTVAPAAHACTGDPCDGICAFWNNPPDPKISLHDCPLR